jgi:hypothetical protein
MRANERDGFQHQVSWPAMRRGSTTAASASFLKRDETVSTLYEPIFFEYLLPRRRSALD